MVSQRFHPRFPHQHVTETDGIRLAGGAKKTRSLVGGYAANILPLLIVRGGLGCHAIGIPSTKRQVYLAVPQGPGEPPAPAHCMHVCRSSVLLRTEVSAGKRRCSCRVLAPFSQVRMFWPKSRLQQTRDVACFHHHRVDWCDD